jgi:iron(III) transport system substrate-binding protein
MRYTAFSLVGILIATIVSTLPVAAAAIDELLSAAKREGSINFLAPSALGPQGASEITAAFNKKFSGSIKVNYMATNSFTKDTAQVVTWSNTGYTPEWDLMVVTDLQHRTLWQRKLHKTYDYKALGLTPTEIYYDNGTVSVLNEFSLPAYNTTVLSAKEVPKSWEDLLDTKWKGGKLGITSAQQLARLAAGPWGEKKTTAYVSVLAKQEPSFGRFPEVYNRLLLGEILVAVTMIDSLIGLAKSKGAPIVHAETIEPVITTAYHVGVIKGARHPNAAHLFSAFLATPEAQKIWENYTGQSSALVPGTKAYLYVQGKQVTLLTQAAAEIVDRLTPIYNKLLGLT